MADYNVGIREYNAEHCRKILSHLPGIFAAGLRYEDDQLIEIHILASTDRNPKQIARDVQSTLFAVYGMEVDHRIISIAQLPDDPFLPDDLDEIEMPESFSESTPNTNTRLLFAGMDSKLKNDVCHVSVHLAHGDEDYVGEAKCRNTNNQRNRTIAQATIDAVHSFLGAEYFSILDVKQLPAWGMTIVVSIVEYVRREGAEPVILIGAAAQPDNAPVGVVRSVLDALNRSISRLSSY